MQYQHLFFDLDHTIWDFETNAGETLADLYESHNLLQKGIHDFDYFIKQYCYHNDRLWERYTKGSIKQEELRWKRMWLTLLDFKIGDEVLARKMSAEFLERLPFKKNLFPYTFEILSYLKDKGYQLHLITNGFENIQYSKLSNSKLEQYFTHIITSEGANSLKPHKEIFDYALLKANARKEHSIMIGDNIQADIAGAMNAGLDTVFVNHLNIKTEVKPTYIVYHLKELEHIF